MAMKWIGLSAHWVYQIGKYIPPESVHSKLFVGANKAFNTRIAKSIQKEMVKKFNAKRTPEEYKKRVERLVAREEKRRKDIEKAGIKYSFPGYVSGYRR